MSKWTNVGERFNIAGVQYSDYQRATGMKVGGQVRFVGEPANPYDKLAIRIEHKGVKLGYVPRNTTIQQWLWNKHKQGASIIGVITAINKNNPTYTMFTVQALATKEKLVSQKEGEVHFAKMREELSYQYKA